MLCVKWSRRSLGGSDAMLGIIDECIDGLMILMSRGYIYMGLMTKHRYAS
jgi:hypothetical protein